MQLDVHVASYRGWRSGQDLVMAEDVHETGFALDSKTRRCSGEPNNA